MPGIFSVLGRLIPQRARLISRPALKASFTTVKANGTTKHRLSLQATPKRMVTSTTKPVGSNEYKFQSNQSFKRLFVSFPTVAVAAATAATMGALMFEDEIRAKQWESEFQKLVGVDNLKRIGVAVSYVDDATGQVKELFGHQPNAQFTMASIYKIPIAMYCLYLAENGQLDLNAEYTITAEDVIERRFESPRADSEYLIPGQKITFKELLARTFKYSDNTATDILLQTVGGTKIITEWLQQHGIKDLILSRTVKEAIKADSFIDGVSDLGTAAAVNHLLTHDSKFLITEESRDMLFGFMQGCVTAKQNKMITEDLAQHPAAGYKTGSVKGLIANNVSVIKIAENKRLIISVFTNRDPATLDKTKPEENLKKFTDDCQLISSVTASFYNHGMLMHEQDLVSKDRHRVSYRM